MKPWMTNDGDLDRKGIINNPRKKLSHLFDRNSMLEWQVSGSVNVLQFNS